MKRTPSWCYFQTKPFILHVFFRLFMELKMIGKRIIALKNIDESHHHMDMIRVSNVIFLKKHEILESEQAMSWHQPGWLGFS